MATIGNAVRDVDFSKEDLLLLARSLKSDKFRGLLGEFAKEISDPKNQKHYESEVKKWEKQNGVDVVFVDPNPGFVVAIGGGGEGDGDPVCVNISSNGGGEGHVDLVCVNICSSDAVQEPSFVRASQGTTPGHNWSIPHATTKPRHEIVTGEKQLLRELFRGRGAKRSSPSKQLKQVLVHDVVFHPDTLHLASSNHGMKQTVIKTAMDTLGQHYQLKQQNLREISAVKYVGKPVKSVIKKVINKKLNESNEKLSFLNKADDERTSANAGKCLKEAENQSAIKAKEETLVSFVIPKYSVKHVNKADLQDFALQLIPQSGPAWRPQALEVEVHLPGVSRASEVNAEVWQQSMSLTTTSTTPKYKLDLTLPYAVDDELSTAKFDVSTRRLTFVLAVMPANKKDQAPLPSPSSDSGIECDSGYRTISDGDNSSEVSVSSLEENTIPRDEGGDEDDENSVFESAPSSPIKANLIPSYTLKQTEEDLRVVLHCGNIVPGSVNITLHDENTVKMSLASIGGGQTRLQYGLSLVSQHSIAQGGVSHQVNENNVEVVIRKQEPREWETCQIGHGNCLATVHVAKMELTSPGGLPSKDDVVKPGCGERIPNQKNVQDAIPTRKPRVTRAVSMCEENTSTSGLRLKGPTCSWPKGILKRRCRSLSESQLGYVMPLEPLVALETPHEIEVELLEDKDGEDSSSIEEGPSSLQGEKKSVRFNDVVSRQLFRSNSSILGQRAKNQRKALKKQKSRGRHTSESDRDSDASQCYSDPGPLSGNLTASTNTTTDDDDTDVTLEAEENLNNANRSRSLSSGMCNDTFIEVDLDVANNNNISVSQDTVNNRNSTNNNCSNNDNSNNNSNNTSTTNNINDLEQDDGGEFIVKTSKKKRKNNKKKFEPSNNLIFQLDIEP